MNSAVFDNAYTLLNPAQRQAVDTLDGVVMVIAGPGSGKTQLLAIRIANILKQTDIDPSNILCLTFTDSAAYNMRERVAKFVGAETARKIRIQTFHSFGSDVLAEHPEAFGFVSDFRPISEFDQKVLMRKLILDLPFSTSLKSYHEAQGYVYLSTISQRISELKRAGLTESEFLSILEETKTLCDMTIGQIQEILATVTHATAASSTQQLLDLFAHYSTEQQHTVYETLAQYCIRTLTQVLREISGLEGRSTTKPLTAWKNSLFETSNKQLVWKFSSQESNWFDLHKLYEEYTKALFANGWIDFDDMLLLTAEGLQSNPDLRSYYQEKYQYILVDEFQDNNLVQNQIILSLGENPVNEGNPNILVVGDDDQAIYKFGGAHTGVLTRFQATYPKALHITLDINYRSQRSIVEFANEITTQIEDRFLSSKSIRHNPLVEADNAVISNNAFASDTLQYHSVADKILSLINSGVEPAEIAVISRNHSSLMSILPHLNALKVPVAYERSENILDQPGIQLLTRLLRYITKIISHGESAPDELLPTILSHPCWGIDRITLWQLSVQSQKQRWLDSMRASTEPKIQQLADFLLSVSITAQQVSAEETLSILLGSSEIELASGVRYTSPVKHSLFNTASILEQCDTQNYIIFLHSLKTLYKLAREFRSTEYINAKDLLQVIDHAGELGISLMDRTQINSPETAVSLLTAHKAKGLEFEHVFLIDALEDEWFPLRSRPTKLKWPPHLNISPLADNDNDIRRILYVAITRAKTHLYATYPQVSSRGTKLIPLMAFQRFGSVLQDNGTPTTTVLEEVVFPHSAVPHTQYEQEFLKERAAQIRFSASSFIAFVDLAHGGPYNFVERSLLRFPQAVQTSTRYGNVMHKLFENALNSLSENSHLPSLGSLVDQIPALVRQEKIRKDEWNEQIAKATQTLTQYYNHQMITWKPEDKAELNFALEQLSIEGVPVTGKIDRITIRDSSVSVIDYKTGKPLSAKSGKEAQWQKLKYAYQFYFYKLMGEQSKQLGTNPHIDQGEFQFVDPSSDIEIYTVTSDSLEEKQFRDLLQAVYQRVTTLSLPTQEELNQFCNSNGEYDAESSMKFVEWLIANKTT